MHVVLTKLALSERPSDLKIIKFPLLLGYRGLEALHRDVGGLWVHGVFEIRANSSFLMSLIISRRLQLPSEKEVCMTLHM